MHKDIYLEIHSSQKSALELLQAIGYRYISPEDCSLQRGGYYDVLLKDILRGQLRRINRYSYGGVDNEFSGENIERAMKDLDESLQDGLVRTSEKIYDALLLGKSYPETVGAGHSLSFNLYYIDWEKPENNVFHVTQEFLVESQDKEHNAKPDIVLFINGIPFAVIECKAPDIPVSQAVEQTIRNQQNEYIPQLYKYAQLVMATNQNEVKYATAGTRKKFWSIWKEEDTAFLGDALDRFVKGRMATVQDKNIISLFTPERVLELIRYFVLFDANVKKICRYQQYFAVKRIVSTINKKDDNGNRRSGVVWHTQGSGKSLTMVQLAKYILMELSAFKPKVVIVTDRTDLDRQIATTFSHTRLNPARASSGRHLVDLIDNNKADVITTLINKFSTAERLGTRNMSPDIFVLVDESHRSNYGLLSTQMRTVFPNACYIAFTGTPLMKKEKSTMAKFGELIHKYTIQEGVNDKAIVPLIYEGRFVEQSVDEANIDLWFDQTTRHLTDKQKEDLSRKWSRVRRLTSTDARIKRIALDINNHFLDGFKHTGFKALLATNYKRDAIRYWECFDKFGDLECEVVISPPDLRESVDDVDEGSDDVVIKFWHKMMKQYGDSETYEETLKNKFVDGDIDILIVCSKLLTGFDAPRCQVLYIDKELQEHGLLQAIARTNRIYEGKDYGLIVDYRSLIEKLDEAVDLYSGAGLEHFESGDLKGVVVDVLSVVNNVRSAYSALCEIFSEALLAQNDSEAIELLLADDVIREDFYKRLCAFGKELNIVLNSPSAYKAIPRSEIQQYQEAFVLFSKVRRSVKTRYSDAVDNSEYEPIMQNLLDTHLSVHGLKQITSPINILNKDEMEHELAELGSLRAQADAIHSRLTKSISEKHDENPAYYDSFSAQIKEALEEYKEKIITEAEYLKKMRSILDDYRKGVSSIQYPEAIKNNPHAQAFYGVISAILSESDANVSMDLCADIALKIRDIVEEHSKVDWTHNKTIHNRIEQDIDDLFYSYEQNDGLKFSFDVIDKIIENIKTVALRRF